jgi:hypothetical protein
LAYGKTNFSEQVVVNFIEAFIMLNFMCLSLLYSLPQPTLDHAVKSLDQAMADRAKITRYYLELVQTTKGKDINRKYRKKIWDDGFFRRTESVCEFNEHSPKELGFTKIVGRNFDRKGYFFDLGFGPKSTRVVEYFEMNDDPKNHDIEFTDWRHLGLAHGLINVYHFTRIQEAIKKAPRFLKIDTKTKKAEITKVEFKKNKCLLVEIEDKDRASSKVLNTGFFRAWFCSELDFLPIEFHTKVGNFEEITAIEYKQKRNNGIFFPKLVSNSRTMNEELILSETVEIVECKLNEDLDRSVFSLKSLNLPNGLVFRTPDLKDSDPGKLPTWQNDKIDKSITLRDQTEEFYRNNLELMPAPDNPEESNSWVLIVIGCFLGLISITIIARLLRR